MARYIALETRLQQIALTLYDIGAIMDRRQSDGGKGFRLKLHDEHPDAPLSPIFFNLRTADNPKKGPLQAVHVNAIAEAMYDVAEARHLLFDHVVGVPRAGDPFARAFQKIASDRGRSCGRIVLCKNDEDDFVSRSVSGLEHGAFSRGDRVLPVDELVTEGHSKLETLDILRDHGLIVTDLVVLIDRMQGGRKALAARGVTLHALLPVNDLIKTLLLNGRISHGMVNEIIEYFAVCAR